MVLAGMLAVSVLLAGCGSESSTVQSDERSENVIITETGETLILDQDEDTSTEETADDTETTDDADEASDLPAPDVVPEVMPEEPEQEQVITEEDQTEPTGADLQIVFLGDSIFDNNRDGTGVPYLTARACDADCINLAIGGTCAAIELTEQYGDDEWTSKSLAGVVKAICGDITPDTIATVFAGTRAGEILTSGSVDWKDTDYFVIEYGMNDLLRGTPMSNPHKDYDMRTYVGALRHAVSDLGDYVNDATIILCAPNYAMFYNGDVFIGDGNTLNTGYGTLFDYVGSCQYVAKEQGAEFFDAYRDLGINGYTADDYLEDGVHLTQAGRELYADALSKMILSLEEAKNSESTDAE